MTDEKRVDRQGIHIDRELANALAIEEELDSNVVGEFIFPDPSRRRIPAVIYAVLAVLVAVVVDPVPALLPAGLALWHFFSGWRLRLSPEEALIRAAPQVPFSVGHASAAVTFHGLRARPRWSVVLYSAADPPDRRALVVVDATTGETVGEPYTENVPPI